MPIEMTRRRADVLTALHRLGGQIQDPDGQATALLMIDTGHRTTNALSGVLWLLDEAGLIERDLSGRRTYRIALTLEGRQIAERLTQPNHTSTATTDKELAQLQERVRQLEEENRGLKDKLLQVLLDRVA